MTQCNVSETDISRPNRARYITKKSKLHCCKACLKDCIKRDPEETPLQLRAKVSLEIYTLAELQRLSMDSNDATNFLWAEPTAWDCPILPGLPYKPDNIWCFSPQGHVFETAGSCTINASRVGYILILEVLEHSVEHHTQNRHVRDEVREEEIRNVFPGIPVGVVYVEVAHSKHYGAKEDYKFFDKNPETLEYIVMEHKKDAWMEHITNVQDALIQLYSDFKDETIYIV